MTTEIEFVRKNLMRTRFDKDFQRAKARLSGEDLQEPGVRLSEDAYPELTRAQARTVRLVISIPVLTLLIVLSAGAVLYVYLMNMAETHQQLSPAARNSLERAAVTMLLLSIVISVFSSLIGYVLALQIVKPIKELSGRMEAIAGGDFSSGVEPIRLGEFGQLGTTFNRMVEQLNTLFEERDRQIRESFSGAHLMLDGRGRVLQADSAVRRVFGIAPMEILNRSLLELDVEIPVIQRNPRFLDSLASLIETGLSGKASNRSIPIRTGDAKEMRYYASCLPMEGKEEGEPRLLLEVRDISGMAGFYEQIQRADRLAAVGTLATGIAHEIRNPLASIRGMVQLLSESSHGDEASETGEYSTRILKEIGRLEKLVDSIMTFASSDDTPPENVNLNELLREVEMTARMRVGEKAEGIDVIWELDETMPKARLQPEKLRQAFLNLLVNAYQHCAKTGLSPIRIETVYLSVNSIRPIIVCISNPGEPIEEESRERLLEPFYTTKAEGTGLGLPIAYQMFLSNDGLMELECEDGEIQFWVRLPREAAAGRASRLIPRLETPMPKGAASRSETS